MKSWIIALVFAFPAVGMAQDQFSVEYEEKIKIEVPDEVKQRMKERGIQFNIPESRSSKMALSVNGNQSMYKAIAEEEDDEFEGRSGGGRFRMRFGGGNPENEFYKNIEAKEKVNKQDLFGKVFLIEDELDNFEWKITGLQMKVNDYICMEAKTIHGEDTIKAYFTSQIPVSNGPAQFGNLPGLILKVDINDGRRVITATKIDLEAEIETFEKPSKGKKVTQAEYDTLRKEKIEEMREMYGEGRVRMITN